jgi:outer membrane protein assembly factor BamB
VAVPLPNPPGDSGAFTATPLVAGGVVYVQDMKSSVFALDLETGAVRWQHLFSATNPGPDGVAVAGDRVYGATDSIAFALSARTGRLLWQHILVTPTQRFVDIAPQVANGVV